MRGSMLSLVMGAVALVACSGSDGGEVFTPRSGGGSPSGEAQGNTAGEPATTPPACSGEAASAKSLANDADASNVRVVGDAVIFRSGTKVVRTSMAGDVRAELYSAPGLVHAFADDAAIVTIETAEGGGTLLRVLGPSGAASPPNPMQEPKLEPGEGKDGNAIATSWNAGGSYLFASDTSAFYAVADEPQGEVVYRIPRDNPGAMKTLVTVADGIRHPQLGAGALWYVREGKRVFKIELAAANAPGDPEKEVEGELAAPTEVFGIGYASCGLTVGTSHAFCNTGELVEQRDLTGGNPRTVFELAKSKVKSPFGGTSWMDGTLYIRSEVADGAMQHVIRALKTGAVAEERIVACGRGPIGEVAVGRTHVVWAERGKGVFAAPR